MVFPSNVFLWKCSFFENKALQKGGQNVPKCSKIFLAWFWVLNDILWKLKVFTYLTQKKCRGFTETILKWHFMEAESIYIPHTKKMPMLFLHTVKNSFYKGVLLVRVFQTKKKVIFRTKFWTFISFPLLMGSQPYLQGISTLRRAFRKKKVFWFF